MRSAVLVTLTAIPLSAASIAAQTFRFLRKEHLPDVVTHDYSAAAADIDADGDTDLLIGGAEGSRLLVNVGNLVYEEQANRLPVNPDMTMEAIFVDVDMDLDADIVTASQGTGNRLYLNRGDGTFVDVTLTHLPYDRSYAVASGDVDGDGDPDLAFGNQPRCLWLGNCFGGQDTLHVNDGTGRFTNVTSARLPSDMRRTKAVAMTDVDGDGNLDLVFGGSQGVRVYRNDGSGRFVDVSSVALPGQPASSVYSIASGDVDGDGDVDLVLARDPGSTATAGLLYLNDGSGRFRDVSATHVPVQPERAFAVALADVDGDLDLDLVAGAQFRRNALLLNDGAAFFSSPTTGSIPADVEATLGLSVFDADLDGDNDVVFANAGSPTRLLLNDGNGIYADGVAGAFLGSTDHDRAVAVSELNGDGHPDVAIAGMTPEVYFGDGTGWYLSAAVTLPNSSPNGSPQDLAFVDVDGDGDQDLVVAHTNQNGLFLNDGTGRFTGATAARLPQDADWSLGVATGDLDGDGDQDLVFANTQGTNRTYLNDGSGTFTFGAFPLDVDASHDVAAVDVDGDLDLDLVFANHGRNRLYINGGNGAFVDVSATHLQADADSTNGVALADVDGDGDPDLVTGNGGPGTNRLYLNDGGGRFSAAASGRLPGVPDRTEAVLLADVDDDGDVDLFAANQPACTNPSTGRNALYLNDGTGFFTDVSATEIPRDSLPTSAVAGADLDHDGDQDLILVSEDNCSRGFHARTVWVNLSRQIHAPFLGRLGHSFPLEIFSRQAQGGVPAGVFPAVGLRALRMPIPVPGWGSLFLDPRASVLLPFVPLTGSGRGRVALVLPNVPTLLGAEGYAQALFVEPATGNARFSNHVRELLR